MDFPELTCLVIVFYANHVESEMAKKLSPPAFQELCCSEETGLTNHWSREFHAWFQKREGGTCHAKYNKLMYNIQTYRVGVYIYTWICLLYRHVYIHVWYISLSQWMIHFNYCGTDLSCRTSFFNYVDSLNCQTWDLDFLFLKQNVATNDAPFFIDSLGGVPCSP